MLAAFPENYRLFEHRRAANLENTNTRGPNDRRDVYLYGHPQGRKKRFRSPADFLPHLIWLSADESGDPQNCGCKLCTPDEMIKAADEMAALQRKLFDRAAEGEEKRKPIQQTISNPAANHQATNQSRPPTKVATPKSLPHNSLPAPTPHVKSQTSTAISAKPSPVTAQVPVPAPPVTPRNEEQRRDSQPHTFIYRDGELVWYITAERHLALGAIISRSLFEDSSRQDKAAYVIQPISYPFNHPTGLITTQEQDIKPWLAYSTPSPQIPEVGDGESTYDQVPWETISRRYPDQALLRAGSICAARMVDASYTLFQPLTSVVPGVTEIEFNGIYLGGEMVWTGEAVRLQTRDDCKDIMIVSKIIEKVGSSPNVSADVEFVGDIYTPATKAHNPNRPLPPNTYLPHRVREDLRYRNRFHIARLNMVMYWQFTQGQQRISISKIKGRWYESKLILPSTNPEALQRGIEDGSVPDVGDQFNARGPAQSGSIGEKKLERRLAYSRSLPSGLQFGIQFSIPQQTGSVPIDLSGRGSHGESNIGDFVDIDQLEQGHFARNFIN